MCNIEKVIWSETKKNDVMDANTSAVSGTMATGGGHAQLEEVFSTMDLPPMTNKTYKKIEDKVKLYSSDAKKVPSPPAAETHSPEVNLKKKTLQGGVSISDTVLGSGTLAKSGKTVTVYYSGRLKATNELFDAMTSGSGLSFRLGRGEVIGGWEIGLVGMKVGGKRVVTCPPNMAYGLKGFPPKIPPNSTLVFEVELKAVK